MAFPVIQAKAAAGDATTDRKTRGENHWKPVDFFAKLPHPHETAPPPATMPEPNTQSAPPVAIPESLHRQLEDFRRHLWRVKVFEAFAAGVVGLLVSFLLVYGLDRLWVTPGLVRLGILIGGTSLFALFAPFWLYRWVWRHRREAQLARLIARRFPGLGDRLLGVVELQSQREDADGHPAGVRHRGVARRALRPALGAGLAVVDGRSSGSADADAASRYECVQALADAVIGHRALHVHAIGETAWVFGRAVWRGL